MPVTTGTGHRAIVRKKLIVVGHHGFIRTSAANNENNLGTCHHNLPHALDDVLRRTITLDDDAREKNARKEDNASSAYAARHARQRQPAM